MASSSSAYAVSMSDDAVVKSRARVLASFMMICCFDSTALKNYDGVVTTTTSIPVRSFMSGSSEFALCQDL